jgi:hypothetical protein
MEGRRVAWVRGIAVCKKAGGNWEAKGGGVEGGGLSAGREEQVATHFKHLQLPRRETHTHHHQLQTAGAMMCGWGMKEVSDEGGYLPQAPPHEVELETHLELHSIHHSLAGHHHIPFALLQLGRRRGEGRKGTCVHHHNVVLPLNALEPAHASCVKHMGPTHATVICHTIYR